ncbi:MAG: hypothetical protein MI924_27475 [Chloroflexales bacterium]|nr:hypothetical protein [Chloroflexales bacterium]
MPRWSRLLTTLRIVVLVLAAGGGSPPAENAPAPTDASTQRPTRNSAACGDAMKRHLSVPTPKKG